MWITGGSELRNCTHLLTPGHSFLRQLSSLLTQTISHDNRQNSSQHWSSLLWDGACGTALCTESNNGFLLTVFNERGCRFFLLPTDMHHTPQTCSSLHTEDLLLKLKTPWSSCFLFQDYYYTKYPLTCPTSKSSADLRRQTRRPRSPLLVILTTKHSLTKTESCWLSHCPAENSPWFSHNWHVHSNYGWLMKVLCDSHHGNKPVS